MSSTWRATFGNSSLTSMPLWPWGRNFHGEASSLPVSANCTRGFANGRSFPSSAVSFGFGSNVSMCDGPPFMNMKITRRARAGRWNPAGGPAAMLADVCPSNADAASQPNPTADCSST